MYLNHIILLGPSSPLTSGSIVDAKIQCHFEEKLDPTRHDEHESLLTKEEASNLMVRNRDLDRKVKINRLGPIVI